MQVEQTQAAPATPSAASAPAPTSVSAPDAFGAALNEARESLAAREKAAEAHDDEVFDTSDTDAAAESAGDAQGASAAPGQPAQAAQAVQEPPKALEPPSYWSRERKEAFKYQPRETQEAWLAADPEPHARWDAETKEAFAKLPREAKELFLSRVTNVERGFNQKLQGLAAERKLAEEIRSAIPPHIRQYMTEKQLSEPQVFATLLKLQQESMQDPAGYLRRFVTQNKLNPAEIFGPEVPQPGAPLPVDVIRSHPEYVQLYNEFAAMQRAVQEDRARQAEAESRRVAAEYETIVSKTDGDGNPLYPYIRLLADPMARIIEEDPEQFGSMGTSEKFATAYALALEQFPELQPVKRTAVPKPADVPAPDAHTLAEQKRQEQLTKAITPKPRASTPPVNGSASTGDPLEDALRGASRQLGLTR